MDIFVNRKKFLLLMGIALFVSGALFGFTATVKAANVGDIVNFNVDKGFDSSGRTQLPATLVKATPKLYFYIEKPWLDLKTPAEQQQIMASLDDLSNEFDNNIYPTLTSFFGFEWNPGIDNDSRITILFESLNNAEGGYFREADEYEKLQFPSSNEREMLYLSVDNINGSFEKIFLGHEFTHLITFNQKNKKFGVEEDTWLNEARADYSSTILGYDSNYEGSNLQQRVKDFIDNPSDSITEWTGSKYDYASTSLFMHYLVDQYGINILSNSLKSRLVGIASINEAISRSGAKEDFAQAFTNWTIALVVNNCSQGSKYCYSDENLNNIRVSPTLIFLPLTGSSSLSVTNVTKNWVGNWQKIIGGSGNLKLDFSSLNGLNFQVPYIVCDKSNNCSIESLFLGRDGKGGITIQDFGTDYKSLIIIPSLQTKISGFDDIDLIYPYSFTIDITGKDSGADQTLIQKLLAQIESLKAEIAKIQAQNNSSAGIQNPVACSQLNSNLSFGMSNSQEIKCLQTFLKNQGGNIYPEGFVTGNFGELTKKAVVRFQEKYSADILAPAGLSSGSGYVGSLTRAKINQILRGL